MTTQAETNRALSKSLDLLEIIDTEHTVIEEDTPQLPATTEQTPTDCKKADDYEEARESLRKILTKGTQALDNLMTLAVEAESIRAYETIPALIAALTDISTKLVDHHKKIEATAGKPNPPLLGGDTHNTIMFAGTSKDLQKMIQELNGKTIEQSPING